MTSAITSPQASFRRGADAVATQPMPLPELRCRRCAANPPVLVGESVPPGHAGFLIVIRRPLGCTLGAGDACTSMKAAYPGQFA
jgi:hypothetical protein